jgi:translation initiation factor IF-2
MTDQNETTKPTKPLTLSTTARSGSAAAKGGGETQVRQKFSHGRTRAVTVEVKKTAKRPGAPAPAAAAPAPPRRRRPARALRQPRPPVRARRSARVRPARLVAAAPC